MRVDYRKDEYIDWRSRNQRRESMAQRCYRRTRRETQARAVASDAFAAKDVVRVHWKGREIERRIKRIDARGNIIVSIGKHMDTHYHPSVVTLVKKHDT